MADIKIAIINRSTVLKDVEVGAIVPALQIQVSRHFAPLWGIDADLSFVGADEAAAPGSWWLVVLDDSDQAGTLGYHDLTSDGLPAGKIFAKTDIDNHLSWSVTASHELLELLCDPDINLTVFVQSKDGGGMLYACEVCDPCEDDQYGYMIDGIKVSDFLLPAYFQPSLGRKYDYAGMLKDTAPTLLPGGYISQYDVTGGKGWHQVMKAGEGLPHRGHLRAPIPGGRADKRRRHRSTWQQSRLVLPPGTGPSGRLVLPPDPGPSARLVLPPDPPRPNGRSTPTRN